VRVKRSLVWPVKRSLVWLPASAGRMRAALNETPSSVASKATVITNICARAPSAAAVDQRRRAPQQLQFAATGVRKIGVQVHARRIGFEGLAALGDRTIDRLEIGFEDSNGPRIE